MYLVDIPKIKPSPGTLRDDFFDAPKAVCKKGPQNRTRRYFWMLITSWRQPKLFFSPESYTKGEKTITSRFAYCFYQ